MNRRAFDWDHCQHRPWRRWFITYRLARWAYWLGLTAGATFSYSAAHNGCTTLQLRGQRRYILGASRETWGCWFRGHRRGHCPEGGAR